MTSASATETRTLGLQTPFEQAPKFQRLVELQTKEVVPRVVRLRLRSLLPSLDEYAQDSYAQGYTAGIWWPSQPLGSIWDEASYRCGALRIRYGSSPGIFREVYVDLRGGEFNVPPCENVAISAAYWSPRYDYGDDGSYGLEVQAEIATGEAIESTPLVLTAARVIDPVNGPNETCWVPPGAYAFDAYAGFNRLIVENEAGLYVERNPSTGLWVPPSTPILLGASRSLSVSADAPVKVTIQFYVR